MGATSKVLSDQGQARPTADLGRQAVEEISTQLRQLLADSAFSCQVDQFRVDGNTSGLSKTDYGAENGAVVVSRV